MFFVSFSKFSRLYLANLKSLRNTLFPAARFPNRGRFSFVLVAKFWFTALFILALFYGFVSKKFTAHNVWL